MFSSSVRGDPRTRVRRISKPPVPRNKKFPKTHGFISDLRRRYSESRAFKSGFLYISYLLFVLTGGVIFYVTETSGMSITTLEPRVKRKPYACIGRYDIWTAIFYAFNSASTIGFGQVHVCSHFGRSITVIYSAIGLPFLVYVLADLGAHQCRFLVMLYSFLLKRWKKSRVFVKELDYVKGFISKTCKLTPDRCPVGHADIPISSTTGRRLNRFSRAFSVSTDIPYIDSYDTISLWQLYHADPMSLCIKNEHQSIDTPRSDYKQCCNEKLKSQPDNCPSSNQHFKNSLRKISNIRRDTNSTYTPIARKPKKCYSVDNINWNRGYRDMEHKNSGGRGAKSKFVRPLGRHEPNSATRKHIDPEFFDNEQSNQLLPKEQNGDVLNDLAEELPDLPPYIFACLGCILVFVVTIQMYTVDGHSLLYSIYYSLIFFTLQQYETTNVRGAVSSFVVLIFALAIISTGINAGIYNVENVSTRVRNRLITEVAKRKSTLLAMGIPPDQIDPEAIVNELISQEGSMLTRSTIPNSTLAHLRAEAKKAANNPPVEIQKECSRKPMLPSKSFDKYSIPSLVDEKSEIETQSENLPIQYFYNWGSLKSSDAKISDNNEDKSETNTLTSLSETTKSLNSFRSNRTLPTSTAEIESVAEDVDPLPEVTINCDISDGGDENESTEIVSPTQISTASSTCPSETSSDSYDGPNGTNATVPVTTSAIPFFRRQIVTSGEASESEAYLEMYESFDQLVKTIAQVISGGATTVKLQIVDNSMPTITGSKRKVSVRSVTVNDRKVSTLALPALGESPAPSKQTPDSNLLAVPDPDFPSAPQPVKHTKSDCSLANFNRPVPLPKSRQAFQEVDESTDSAVGTSQNKSQESEELHYSLSRNQEFLARKVVAKMRPKH